ncbi:hypothetical protein [Mesorhizobium sp. M7A.F.Ca.CA.004.02.1.1]|uniref:hypothetical protein n=1 Tax=Mesorhizobium sp. M7A.F.Ca.CA.004.02.1.1 TaxID=2496690 RepID=UPI000FC9DEA9|nr:hypothetical protein [Mesorhizobium sp. M7A.F.Ca.CA.004.02.1.1]RVB05683.1 hypothetical protein EN912_02150 [Mesorhizobium sp. M7A.F.Ca.CA.004.02.1.1]
MDNTTAGIAVTAVVSPMWLPLLHSVSDGAALIAPILGTIWLVVQISTKAQELIRKARRK